MASQYCLRALLAGLLAAAAFAPGSVIAQPHHAALAAGPWRYGASVEGHVPVLPQVLRDAVREGGSIQLEVNLFAFASLALEASFDPHENWWGMSADIAAPGARSRADRGTRADQDETLEGVPDFWDVYIGSRSRLARFRARLQVIAGKVLAAPGSRMPTFGSVFPTLH